MANNKPDYREPVIVNKKLLFVTYLRFSTTFLLILIMLFFVNYSNWHYALPVKGYSMQPTVNAQWYENGEDYNKYDIVLVKYNNTPNRGDIIIVDFNEFKDQFDPDVSLLLKRVIALSGDTLNIQWIDNELVITVNGEVLNESFDSPTYAHSCYTTFQNKKHNGVDWVTKSKGIDLNEQTDGTITIPAGYYFALGDNRGNSLDGSEFGPLPNYTVLGVVDTIVPNATFLNWLLRNLFGIVL